MPYKFNRWRAQIQGARDEDAIAHVMRNYRLTLLPAMVESLSGECQEALDKSDIPAAALMLLRAEITHHGHPEVRAFLHEVAQAYAAASVKIAGWRSGV